MKPLVSVVTVTYNSSATVEKNLQSVSDQDYKRIEHIIIDGRSTDDTLNIVKNYNVAKLISEKDKGPYDAMNNGIKLAKGEIIAILNSDDYYASTHTISEVVNHFQDVDIVYGDVIYVDRKGRKVRHYKSPSNPEKGFKSGGMAPAHPAFFVRKTIYDKCGRFITDGRFCIANDYEFIVRVIHKHDVSYKYVPQVFAKMLIGGKATASFTNILKGNSEIIEMSRMHGIQLGWGSVAMKLARKWLGMKIHKR